MKIAIALLFTVVFFLDTHINGQTMYLQPDKVFYKLGDTAVIKIIQDSTLLNYVRALDSVSYTSAYNNPFLDTDKNSAAFIIEHPGWDIISKAFKTYFSNAVLKLLDTNEDDYKIIDSLKAGLIIASEINWRLKTVLNVLGPKTEFVSIDPLPALDIVPLNNTYHLNGLNNYTAASFKVCFNGSPLPKTIVKVRHRLANGSVEVKTYKTSGKGIFRVPVRMPSPGDFVVNCSYLDRFPGHQNPLYSTSLSYGYGKGNFFIKRRIIQD